MNWEQQKRDEMIDITAQVEKFLVQEKGSRGACRRIFFQYYGRDNNQ